MRNGLKLMIVYTAVILGAGFATGQELLQYFVGYGRAGLWGMALAGVVFGLTGWALLDICRRENITDYKQLMRHLLGPRLGIAMEIAAAAFLFVLFAAMLSGGGALLRQHMGLPFTAGVLLVAVAVWGVLRFGLAGMVWANAVLTPLLVAAGVAFGLYLLFSQTASTLATARFGNTTVPGWVVAALVYAAYNMVAAVSVLAAASKLAASRKDAAIGGLAGGAVLTVLAFCMAVPLYLHYANILSVEIPFLAIVSQYGAGFSVVYLVLLLCAVVTTAAANAFGFTEWATAYVRLPRKRLCAVFVLAGIPAAHVGFSNLVAYAYPAFGLLGIFQILVLLLSWKGRAPAKERRHT